MPADREEDRAVVEAGGAADAAEHVVELSAEHGRAAVVEQHDVEFAGPVEIGGAFRSGGEGDVGRDFLPGGRTRQQAQQGHRVVEGRHHLLDAGDDDMGLGQGLGEVAVALVGDDGGRAGFGDQEIGAGDADIGGDETLAQHLTPLVDDGARLVERPLRRQLGVGGLERIGPLLPDQMEGRRQQMAGRLVAQLDDIFAHVGFDRNDAASLKMIVERDLLGDHRLALGDGAGAQTLADPEHELARLGRGARPMDMGAVGDRLPFEFLEIEIEMGERVFLDRLGLLAQRLEFGQPVIGLAALDGETHAGLVERLLQDRVAQRGARIGLELGTGGLHASRPGLARRRDGHDPVGHAGEHLGDMAHPDGGAFARQPAGDVEQAAEIAGQQRVGAGGGDVGRLVAGHAHRDVGIFDAEGAAEAAAGFRALEFDQRRALDAFQQPARLLLDAQLAQAGAGIVIGDRAVIVGDHAHHAHDVDQERDQLVGPFRQMLGAGMHRRLVLEEARIVFADHPGAGARGRDQIVEALEQRDGAARDVLRVGAVAAVIGGLAAAGLRHRHLDRAAGALQQGHRGEADGGTEQIDQAGDEQADARLHLRHDATPRSLIRADMDDDLAEIAPLEQIDQALGRGFQAFDPVFLVLHRAGGDPGAHRRQELRKARAIVEVDDEALHADALRQQGAEQHRALIGPVGQFLGIVFGDDAAQGNPRAGIEQRQHRPQHLAADILEINVDALGAGGGELGLEIGVAMIDAGVETQLRHREVALVWPAGDAHGATSLQLGDLADHRADAARGRSHRHRFARLGRADIEQPHIGGEARHAQHAQRLRGLRHAGGQGEQVAPVAERVILPAAIGEDQGPLREFGVARLDHARHRAAGHDSADLDRFGVGRRVAHPPAHIGIEGEEQGAQQHLARARPGNRTGFEAEVGGLRRTLRPGGEDDASIAIRSLCHDQMIAIE